jgi:hypothetical protein
MLNSRRFFLRGLAEASTCIWLFQSSPPIPQPRKRTEIDPPAGEDKQDNENEERAPNSGQRSRLQRQEKEFRQTIQQLLTRVGDLKTQVDGLHTSDVFSIDVVRQTEEIEKLAKQLKRYAKP